MAQMNKGLEHGSRVGFGSIDHAAARRVPSPSPKRRTGRVEDWMSSRRDPVSNHQTGRPNRIRIRMSSTLRAPSSVWAASTGALPSSSRCGRVIHSRANCLSSSTYSASASRRARRSARSLSGTESFVLRRFQVASGTNLYIPVLATRGSVQSLPLSRSRERFGNPALTALSRSRTVRMDLPSPRISATDSAAMTDIVATFLLSPL